jgi:hypothetical protein
MEEYCGRCSGISILLIGVVILLNLYLLRWNMWLIVGSVLTIWGIVRIAKPSCGCSQGCTAPPLVAQKRR